MLVLVAIGPSLLLKRWAALSSVPLILTPTASVGVVVYSRFLTFARDGRNQCAETRSNADVESPAPARPY